MFVFIFFSTSGEAVGVFRSTLRGVKRVFFLFLVLGLRRTVLPLFFFICASFPSPLPAQKKA